MLFCGIDIGTTNSKAVIIDRDNKLIGRFSIPQPLSGERTRPSAQSWYEHFVKILEHFSDKGLFGQNKVVCSLTAQGGSFVFLDAGFKPLDRAYSWMSRSSDEAVKQLTDKIDCRKFYHIAGWEPDAWLVVCKVIDYLKDIGNQKRNFQYLATVPDYIASQLSGKFISDITNAQITGLCDINARQWSSEILKAVKLDLACLPKISKIPQVILPDVDVGKTKIDLVSSSNDQYAVMKAAFLKNDGDVILGTGTAWVINGKTSRPCFENKTFFINPGRDFCADGYGYIVAFGTIGNAFDKLLNRLQIDLSQMAQIEKDFKKVPLPDKTVKADDENDSDKTMTIKRFMESVACRVAFMLEKLRPYSKVNKLIMTGGATGSSFWPAVIADVCGVPVEAVDFPEFTAYGAALFAKEAVNENIPVGWPKSVRVKLYSPTQSYKYRQWYQNHQRPLLEKEFLSK
jgi:sugar (pentulose or hexulose) kinase